jgi:hypothetical protein
MLNYYKELKKYKQATMKVNNSAMTSDIYACGIILLHMISLGELMIQIKK